MIDFNDTDLEEIPGQERDDSRGYQDAIGCIDFNSTEPLEVVEADGKHAPPAVIEPPAPAHFEAVAHAERMQQPAKRKKKEVPAGRPDYLKGPGVVRASNEVDLAGCLANVQIVLERDAQFRDRLTHNVFADRVECWDMPWDDPDGRLDVREWTANDTTELTIHVQRLGVPATSGICREAVPSVARKYPSNPPFDYLAGLKWDGELRLIIGAQRYFGAAVDWVTSEFFVRWMISGVARIDRPGSKVDHAIILEGPQGRRKSAALRALMAIQDWFTDDLGAAIKNKDAQHAMRGKWVIELPELSALKGVSAEELKAWLVRQVDRYRPPYGHAPADFPRANIFAGTSNEGEYLEDPTGARRMWPIRCGKIDVEAIERDRDQLWAEAVHRYKAGEKWWLSDELEAKAREAQAVRTAFDPWADRVINWCELQSENSITMARILTDCLDVRLDLQNAGLTRRVVSILAADGWVRVRAPAGLDLDNKSRRPWIYRKRDRTE